MGAQSINFKNIFTHQKPVLRKTGQFKQDNHKLGKTACCTTSNGCKFCSCLGFAMLKIKLAVKTLALGFLTNHNTSI